MGSWSSLIHSYGSASCSTEDSPSGSYTFTSNLIDPYPVGAFPYRRWRFFGVNLAAGEAIRIYNDSGILVHSIEGPFSGDFDSGCVS